CRTPQEMPRAARQASMRASSFLRPARREPQTGGKFPHRAVRHALEAVARDAAQPGLEVGPPRRRLADVLGVVGAAPGIVTSHQPADLPGGPAAMVVIDQRPRVIDAVRARPQRGGGGIDVFARKRRAGAEPLVKSADPLENVPAKCQVGALHRARRDEAERRKLASLLRLVYRDRVVAAVEQQDAAAQEPEAGIFIE